MENILILFGSPNEKGYTASLFQIYYENYLKGISDEYLVKRYSLYQQKIQPCIGCGKCHENGICRLNENDDMGEILQAIEWANTVFLVTPVYFSGFPAPVKAMIDRTEQVYERKRFEGRLQNRRLRRGILLASCGSDDPHIVDGILSGTEQFFDCMDISFEGKLFAANTDHPEQIYFFEEVMEREKGAIKDADRTDWTE